MRARRQDLSTRALEEEYLGLALNLITQSQQSRLSSVGRVQDPTYFQAHLQSLGRRAKMNTTADQTKLLDPDIEDLSLMATEKTTNSRRKVLLGFSIGILLLLSCWAAHVAPSSTSSLQKSTGPLKLAKRASNYAESVRVGGDLLMQLAGAGPGHPTSPVTHDTLFNGASGWNSATATDEGIPWLLLPIDSALRRFFDLDIHSDEESDHVTWEQNSRFMLGGRERPVSHWPYARDALKFALLISFSAIACRLRRRLQSSCWCSCGYQNQESAQGKGAAIRAPDWRYPRSRIHQSCGDDSVRCTKSESRALSDSSRCRDFEHYARCSPSDAPRSYGLPYGAARSHRARQEQQRASQSHGRNSFGETSCSHARAIPWPAFSRIQDHQRSQDLQTCYRRCLCYF